MATRRKHSPLPRTESPEEISDTMDKKPNVPHKIRLKIIGVGGAGCNTVSHIATQRTGQHPLDGVELIAVNTDEQSLANITGAEKIQIGNSLTHGLSAGGDAEIGARAAQQDGERLEAVLQNTDVVFLSAGLGGGTGTGASPVVARVAKDQGALVLAFVAMPFAFEGERRRQQALTGLEQLKAQADAVICIQNDKIFKMVGEETSVVEAFKRSDELFVIGAASVWQLLGRKGLINLDFGDLRAALGSKHCEGLFSHGAGEGPHKAREAVKALMENPLLESGDVLAKAEGLLVSIRGGPDLTVADVQRVVEPITRIASRANVSMGAAIDENLTGRITVTVIAAANILPRRAVLPTPAKAVASPVQTQRPSQPVAPAPALPATEAAPAPKKSKKPVQENLPLGAITRGRFDKSEPTIYDGEDLDVPTYLRRGIKLAK